MAVREIHVTKEMLDQGFDVEKRQLLAMVQAIELKAYRLLKERVIAAGYSKEIRWAENIKLCSNELTFAEETIWVIINAGMKEQVARRIWTLVGDLLQEGKSASDGFGHKLKCRAIDWVWGHRHMLFDQWQAAQDKLTFLESLPHIGPITKFHLARNLGMDVCKPDRHLVRIAGAEGPAALCRRLALASGDRIGVVDLVIWRAANLGMV